MRHIFKLFLVAAFLMAAGTAVAGKGGPIASGFWEGNGQAVYPDGTIAEISLVEALLFQDGNFIYGGAEFEVVFGDSDPVVSRGQMSGHITGNSIKGVLGGCFSEAPDCVGVGIFEGKLSGNKLIGTVLDLSDGSTSVISLRRFDD